MNQSERQQALRELCERHFLAIKVDGPHRTTAEEDIAPYFHPEHCAKTIGRYAAVTNHEDVFYVYPDFDDYASACDKAAQFIGDDIHSELPVEVVDLDTGKRWRVAGFEVQWEAGS